MFERFTNQSRRVVVLAQEEARNLDHNYIGTEHLLLGLLHEGKGTGAQALASAGITLEAARAEVRVIIGQGQQAPGGHIPFTPPAKKCLELSLREALQLGDNYIGTGHILLGLIRAADGLGVQVIAGLGADPGQLRERVTLALENDPEARDTPDEPVRVLPSRPGSDTVRRLLDTIDNRLSSIEGRLGISRAEPAAQPGAAEVDRLNAEVDRLRALLRAHDIDPGESGAAGTARASRELPLGRQRAIAASADR